MVEVIGAIRDRWLELGGPSSFLGHPLTDELQMPGPDGGRVSVLEHGSIYWWHDVNGGRAVDVGEMFVHYQGLNCFGEADGGGADEPYVTMAVTAGGQELPALRTPIFEGVEGGASRPHQMLLYRGQPRGIAIVAQLLEHDSGDPEKYQARMQSVASADSAAITAGLVALVPQIGSVVAGPVGSVLTALNGPIAEELGDLPGLGDGARRQLQGVLRNVESPMRGASRTCRGSRTGGGVCSVDTWPPPPRFDSAS
jgi:hypothetical protein